MKLNEFLSSDILSSDEIQDPGLGSKYQEGSKRLMNKDGSFNVIKQGIPGNLRDTYQTLIAMSWTKFLLISLAFIFGLNLVFALIYVGIGVEDLAGDKEGSFWQNLSEAFFFSFQTFTTVGYGRISPVGKLLNFVAVFEASTGLMVFAIITGLLYGRFSRPSIRLLYSDKALIAPYKDGWGFMFRIVNLRKNLLLDTGATVAMTVHHKEGNESKRRYFRLDLEISRIDYFAANWTLVHQIDKNSPFNQLDLNNLRSSEFEIIIQIKAFDNSFGQHVHSRNSYTQDEIVVGAKFKPATRVDKEGNVILPIEEFHDYELVAYP
jgi:inward rectifier potassium channel